jgi:hypothetical protein
VDSNPGVYGHCFSGLEDDMLRRESKDWDSGRARCSIVQCCMSADTL